VPSVGFRAGVAARDITPPLGTPLAGWNRKRVASQVHQPLEVRALVFAGFDQAGAAVRGAVVTLDVLGLDAGWVASFRRQAAARTGIPAGHILVAASHTHSGPPTALSMPEVAPAPPGLCESLADRAVAAIEHAAGSLRDVRVAFGQDRVDFAVNRRLLDPDGRVYWPPRANPDGPVDHEVTVVRLDADEGPLAILFAYACHPTVGGPSVWIGPDYPGPARQTVEAALGGTALFVLGNCGDVRSNLTVPDGRFNWQTTLDDVNALGRRLGEAVVRACRAAEPIVSIPVVIESEIRRLRLRDGRFGAEAEFQAIRWGQVMFLANPGETFTAIGLEVKRRLGGRLVLVSCANGYAGYVPTVDAYPHGGYEVERAHRWWERDQPFAPGSAAIFTEALGACARAAGWPLQEA
jgi:neutral ceramidase